MSEVWKTFGAIALIALFVVPVSLVLAGFYVPPWVLIAGHCGTTVTGIICAEIGREE